MAKPLIPSGKGTAGMMAVVGKQMGEARTMFDSMKEQAEEKKTSEQEIPAKEEAPATSPASKPAKPAEKKQSAAKKPASGKRIAENGNVIIDGIDLGPKHRLTTAIPVKLLTYCRLKANSNELYNGQICNTIIDLIVEDMKKHPELTKLF